MGTAPSYRHLRQVMEDTCALLAEEGAATARDCRHVSEAWAKVGVGPPTEDDVPALDVTLYSGGEVFRHDEAVLLSADVSGGTVPYTYRFDFGDGTSQTNNEGMGDGLASHFYEPGTYTASVLVTDAVGQTGSDQVSFETLPRPAYGCDAERVCPAGAANVLTEQVLPDCPDLVETAPSWGTNTSDNALYSARETSGCLGRRLICRYGYPGTGPVIQVELHPSDRPEVPAPCSQTSCSGEGSSAWTLIGEEGDSLRHFRWAAGAYATVASNDYPDHPDQTEITRAVAEELFAAIVPLALSCNEDEYGAPAE